MTILKGDGKKQLFYGLHALIPVAICAVLFLLTKTSGLHLVVSTLYGPGHSELLAKLVPEKLLMFIITYFRDMLWAYAVVFAVSYWNSDCLVGIRRSFITVALFELGLIVFESITAVSGVFDVRHVLAILAGTAFGMGVVLVKERHLIRRKKRMAVRLVEVILVLVIFASGAIASAVSKDTLRDTARNEVQAAVEASVAFLEND